MYVFKLVPALVLFRAFGLMLIERNSIYSIPHHHVISKFVNAGFLTPVINPIRRFLIESLYRRLATMFPESANWALDNEE